MSKSTLSINVKGGGRLDLRTIEVPCRLPDSFTFKVYTDLSGLMTLTAELTQRAGAWAVEDVVDDNAGMDEDLGPDEETAKSASEAILSDVKTYLGMGPDVMPTTRGVLSSIALAYEAEVAAYDAAVKAHAALPRVLHSLALAPTHPAENDYSPAVLMLRKYVEYVVEQACKAQTERAEQAAKGAK